MFFLIQFTSVQPNWPDMWYELGIIEADSCNDAMKKLRTAWEDGHLKVPDWLQHMVEEGYEGGFRIQEIPYFHTLTEFKDAYPPPPEPVQPEAKTRVTKRKGKRGGRRRYRQDLK